APAGGALTGALAVAVTAVAGARPSVCAWSGGGGMPGARVNLGAAAEPDAGGAEGGGGVAVPAAPLAPLPAALALPSDGAPDAGFEVDADSAGTAARPTTARPVAGVPLSAASSSTGFVEVPATPDFACVSVIN
ncbi:hypothetical protein K1W54_30745, partial [Micromonospora sp. CPCC 205371]|nr:hypothetical protein [Micromonospora sp. CPCC 205371]